MNGSCSRAAGGRYDRDMRIDLAAQRPVGSDVRRQVRSSAHLGAAERAAGGSRERVEAGQHAFACFCLAVEAGSITPANGGRGWQRLTQKALDAGKSALRVRRPGLWSRLVAGVCRGYAMSTLKVELDRGPKLSVVRCCRCGDGDATLSQPARGPLVPPGRALRRQSANPRSVLARARRAARATYIMRRPRAASASGSGLSATSALPEPVPSSRARRRVPLPAAPDKHAARLDRAGASADGTERASTGRLGTVAPVRSHRSQSPRHAANSLLRRAADANICQDKGG